VVSSDPAYDELTDEFGQNGRTRAAPRGVPQDQAAEQSVLGAILAEPGIYERLAGMLVPEDFMDPRHRAIFAAVLAVFDRYEAIDQITVAAELGAQNRLSEAGGQAYLNQLVYELPATVGAEHYARLVQRAATYRDMIRAAGEITTHHQRGSLFENAVISEALKHAYNNAVRHPHLSFYRTSGGLECDLLYPARGTFAAVEIKSGATIANSWLSHLGRIKADLPDVSSAAVVYGGDQRQHRSAGDVVPLRDFAQYLAALDPPAPPLSPTGVDL